MEPVEVHDGATKYLNWVMEHVGKLWGSEGGAQTGTVEDIVESSPHPAHIMTLAQFRELCLDTGITCRDVLFASIGRQWQVRMGMRAWYFHTMYAKYQSCMV